MGKLINIMLFIVAIEFALVMFLGATPIGGTLWFLVTAQGFDWDASSLVALLGDTMLLLAASGAIIGAALGFKYDFLIFAGIAGTFLSFGACIFDLYATISTNFPNVGSELYPINASLLIIGPLALIFYYGVMKFWRGND